MYVIHMLYVKNDQCDKQGWNPTYIFHILNIRIYTKIHTYIYIYIYIYTYIIYIVIYIYTN